VKDIRTITGRNTSLLSYVYSNIIIPLVFLCCPGIIFAGPGRYEFQKPLMGSPFRLVFYAPDDSTAESAAHTVFAHLEQLNTLMSDYLDGSEINRLSGLSGRGKWVRVSDDLFAVLDSALVISQLSDGAFDATIGPVIQVWRKYFRLQQFPSKKEIRNALARCGYQHMQLDRRFKLVKLAKSGMRLDLGGIGKGFAADEALRVLRHMGIRSAMIDAGGDLALSDAPPGEAGWKISISSAQTAEDDEVVVLANCGIATSGATYRYFEHKGKKYSHIVDPATGVGLTHHIRTTVIASSATKADALATAVSVAGEKKRVMIRRNFPDATIRVVPVP